MSPAEPDSKRITPLTRLLLLLLALGGAAVVLAGAMARVPTYDEDQFAAAGLFVSQGMLPYRDFAYLHMPLYPFVLAAAFKLSGDYYLLTGRLLTFALSMLSGGLLWALLRRLGAGRILSCVLMGACLASPFMAAPLSNVRNDMLPLTLFLAGLLLHVWAGDRVWWGLAAAAALMGLAVESKLSYAFGPVALVVHALFLPRRRLPPVLIGLALAALPVVWLIGMSGLDPVRFALLDWTFLAPLDWYRQQDLEAQLDAPVRLQMLFTWLSQGGNMSMLLLSVALSIVAMARRRKWKRPGALLLTLLVLALAFNFATAPSWTMYFAAVAPLLACCIAHLDRITVHLADPLKKRVLVLVAALPIVPVLLHQEPEALRFLHGDWAGLRVHQTALAVRAALPQGGRVATLFPVLVMDANPVLPAFAAGPVVFRSGDLFPAVRMTRLHAATPATLQATIERERPAGIFAGAYGAAFRMPMDQALKGFAEEHGWRLVMTDPGGGRLWLNPAQDQGPSGAAGSLAAPDVIPRAPN